jgi:hypothetical protein
MATAVPPLSGGPDTHGSEATHAVIIADSAGTVTWAHAVHAQGEDTARAPNATSAVIKEPGDYRHWQIRRGRFRIQLAAHEINNRRT